MVQNIADHIFVSDTHDQNKLWGIESHFLGENFEGPTMEYDVLHRYVSDLNNMEMDELKDLRMSM